MIKAKSARKEKPNQWVNDWVLGWQSDLQKWNQKNEDEFFSPEFRHKSDLEKRFIGISGIVYQGFIMTNVWLQVLFELYENTGEATDKMLQRLAQTRASKKEVAAIRSIANEYQEVFANIKNMAKSVEESRKKFLVYVTR